MHLALKDRAQAHAHVHGEGSLWHKGGGGLQGLLVTVAVAVACIGEGEGVRAVE